MRRHRLDHVLAVPSDEIELQPCPNCGGQGEIRPLMSDPPERWQEYRECPECRGLKLVAKK
ncbi:hypothetical protein GCM10027440_35570 [Nocardiopsis coralliicola]